MLTATAFASTVCGQMPVPCSMTFSKSRSAIVKADDTVPRRIRVVFLSKDTDQTLFLKLASVSSVLSTATSCESRTSSTISAPETFQLLRPDS